MRYLQTIVVLTAAFGAVSSRRHGKKSKRQCSADPAPPSLPTQAPPPPPTEPTPEPPTVPTEPTEPTEPGPMDPPPPTGGGGGIAEYKETANSVGDKWYDNWDFWPFDDPTHGRVRYVDGDYARNNNLTSVSSDGSFMIRADSSSTLDPNGPGRAAVRLQSKAGYEKHTAVLDIQHMPQGPGTWPAYWTCGANWPNEGEFDIIEGVNDGTNNLSSLHTSEGCTMPDGRDQSGSPGYFDCNANGANGNQGCGVVSPDSASFGPNFNAAGGGWFATERTDTYIKVWFWGRGASNVPADVRENVGSVSPSTWGQPTAVFVNDQCDLGAKFGPNNFIINLTFCGDWAGNAYNGGMGACNDFVNNNPGAYAEAYFEMVRMTVYE